MGTLFYRSPRLLILTICLICVWGLSSFGVLPRTEEPRISQYVATVTTDFPGASADRVESLVTERIEQELFELEFIDNLSSTSTLQRSTIAIELKPTVQNVEEAWSEVRDRLSDIAIELPPETSEPEYQALEAVAYTLISALTWTADSPPNYATLSRWADELENQLQNVPGSEDIDLFGRPTEEIVVEANPATLATLGLTPIQFAEQIQASDAKVSAGQLRDVNNAFLLEVDTQLDSLGRIRQIPIQSDATTGQTSLVGEIATVRKGIREPPSSLARVDGRPAVVVAARMAHRQRIDYWAAEARSALAEFRDHLPRDIALQVIFDQSPYVSDRLNELISNLVLGALCVTGVTVIMMGWRSALIVGATLPLSVLIVFAGMRVLQIPLHQISVMGLVIALGLLIDNAIVVVDELKHRLEQGLAPKRAISESVRYAAVPLLASTLTTTLTFMPIALIPGDVGEFLRALPYSVSLALFSSLLLSLTLVPALEAYSASAIAARASRGKTQSNMARRFWTHGFSNPRLTASYRAVLGGVLARPWLGIGIALIWPLLGFIIAPTLPEQFFPPADRDQAYIEVDLAPSATLAQTQSVTQQAEAIVLQHPEVTAVHWFISSSIPSFYFTVPQTGRETENLASGMLQLDNSASSRRVIRALQQDLDQQLPSAQILVRQLERKISRAPIILRLFGPDFEVLRQLGQQARMNLAQINQVTHTRASLTDATPRLALTLDENQAQLTGLTNTSIAQQLDAYLDGAVGGSVLEDTEELPVRVTLSGKDRGNLSKIAALDLLPSDSASETSLPLSSLAEVTLVPDLATINRFNGQRVNIIYAFTEAGALAAPALQEFKRRLNESNFQLPPGYEMEFDGDTAGRDDFVGTLTATLGPLLVVMAGILVLSFNSFRAACVIFLVGIGSIGLALASLWLFRYPLGAMAILGTVGLIGIAINDSIVVLTALRADSRASYGEPRAVEEVVVRSTRHVLTTTFTTIAGFIPLIAAGGEFWPPLAICIAAGVAGATLLALFLVPCAHLLLVQSRAKPLSEVS